MKVRGLAFLGPDGRPYFEAHNRESRFYGRTFFLRACPIGLISDGIEAEIIVNIRPLGGRMICTYLGEA